MSAVGSCHDPGVHSLHLTSSSLVRGESAFPSPHTPTPSSWACTLSQMNKIFLKSKIHFPNKLLLFPPFRNHQRFSFELLTLPYFHYPFTAKCSSFIYLHSLPCIFFIYLMISRQKGLSTFQTGLFCYASMHVCRFSFHLECPFLHLRHTSYRASSTWFS